MTPASSKPPHGVPHALLLVCEPFPPGGATRAAAAITGGLLAGGWTEVDALVLERDEERAGLAPAAFEERLRAARAVVVAAPRMAEHALAGSVLFDVATRARQAGVPAFALTRANGLDAFAARMLDLQAIVSAPGRASLRAAARRLAALI